MDFGITTLNDAVACARIALSEGSMGPRREAMNQSAHILGLMGSIVAALAMTLPTPVFSYCHCFLAEAASGEPARTSQGSPSCCSQGHSPDDASKPHSDTQDRQGSSPCPGDCSTGCKSPCCSVQLKSASPGRMEADFLRGAPAGLMCVLSTQMPVSPTLDGLLRPPRD